MSESPAHGTPASPRLPYDRPSLIVLGSLPELTGNVGMNSNNDGGSGSAKRSQP